MNPIISLLAAIVPQLVQYFTKNYGQNSVTTSVGASFLTLVLVAMQSGGYDQIITFLQTYGESGVVAAAFFIGLRAAVQGYKAIKG